MEKNSTINFFRTACFSLAMICCLWQCTPHRPEGAAEALQPGDYLLKFYEGPYDEPGAPCGYLDRQGDTVIPAGKYHYCYTDTLRSFAVVLEAGGRCVAVDRSGKALYEVYWYDNGPDYLSDGLFRIKKAGKIGYADEAGTIAIPPRFECAGPFEDGKARVALECTIAAEGEHASQRSDDWFYIGKDGERIGE